MVDLAAFDALTRKAFDSLPDVFRSMCADVLIRVADFPNPEVRRDLGIQSAYGLLGLYQGVDLTRQSVLDPTPEPAMVFLYREPILAFARAEGEAVETVVRHVLVHEIGHHFGLSDEDMDAIEQGPPPS